VATFAARQETQRQRHSAGSAPREQNQTYAHYFATSVSGTRTLLSYDYWHDKLVLPAMSIPSHTRLALLRSLLP